MKKIGKIIVYCVLAVVLSVLAYFGSTYRLDFDMDEYLRNPYGLRKSITAKYKKAKCDVIYAYDLAPEEDMTYRIGEVKINGTIYQQYHGRISKSADIRIIVHKKDIKYCIANSCVNKKYLSTNYCKNHKCPKDGCSGERNPLFCKDHTCTIRDCDKYRNAYETYCEYHLAQEEAKKSADKKNSSNYSSSSSSSNSSSKKKDTYGASKYKSASDFADDYWEEFYDYEDDFDDEDDAWDAAYEYWEKQNRKK